MSRTYYGQQKQNGLQNHQALQTDKSKFIPVTKEALEECHYKGGKGHAFDLLHTQ